MEFLTQIFDTIYETFFDPRKRVFVGYLFSAIVIAFLSAAFLTPPDPFSQISLALPIILLYEISIFLAKRIQKNKDKN